MSNSVGGAGGDTFARQPRRDPYAVKGKSTSVIGELRGRLGKPTLIPGAVGAALGSMGKLSLQKQIQELQAGATPVQIKTDKGETLTVGTVRDGRYTGRPEYRDIALKSAPEGGAIRTSLQAAMEQEAEKRAAEGPEPEPTIITPEVTPEVTPEIVPDDLMGSTERGRRRSKRLGGAGTLLEGGGALYE